MKRKVCLSLVVAWSVASFLGTARAGEVDILVRKLVEKNILSPDEAQSIIDETHEEAKKEAAKPQSNPTPDWVQRIQLGGDLRFRNQVDWGKFGVGTAAGSGQAHSRVRERVRARLAAEGKVNEQISAGTRLVTGGTADPRSTNITLGDTNGDFSKTAVMFDQYYIRWEPKIRYLETSKVWLGKFPIPFTTTELLWDDDLKPEGWAIQYVSSSFDAWGLPETKLYANGGMLWIQELSRADTDPMLWAGQVGFIAQVSRTWGSSLDCGFSFYDWTRTKTRTWTQNSAGTNSVMTIGDAGDNKGNIGTLLREYKPIDLVMKFDQKKLFSIELPHGLYGDFIYNTTAPSSATGWLLGGYVGTRKIGSFGQWNVWFDWRSLERDAIPDIMPDSDFYGFSPIGLPGAGGTNVHGFNTGIQFGLLKNTWLNLEYYWSEPIKSTVSAKPYQLVQADINVKF